MCVKKNQETTMIAHQKFVTNKTRAASLAPRRLEALDACWRNYIDAGLAHKTTDFPEFRYASFNAYMDSAMDSSSK